MTMSTKVVNAKDVTPEMWASGLYVYGGRGGWSYKQKIRYKDSGWGNPYRIGPDGTREEVVAKHRADFLEDSQDARARRKRLIATFGGKFIVCHCSPLACHCDVYAEICNSQEAEARNATAH